jgi:hypothetical protein
MAMKLLNSQSALTVEVFSNQLPQSNRILSMSEATLGHVDASSIAVHQIKSVFPFHNLPEDRPL